MSYRTVLDGLHERFATVPGLSTILDHEPTSVEPVVLYSLLDRVERTQSGQVTAMRYRILHRLVFRWQDQDAAEQELIPFVNSIPAAVDADPQLGGRIGMGSARIGEIEAVFVTIGGVLYRALDCYSDVLEKGPVRSGI